MTDCLTIGPYVTGEKPAPLTYAFLDSDGVPIDLTTYTSAEFHYQRSDGPPTVASASVSDAVNGRVTHTWTGSEFSTAGTWWCEFWVGNGSRRYCSRRLEAVVRVPVGAVPAI